MILLIEWRLVVGLFFVPLRIWFGLLLEAAVVMILLLIIKFNVQIEENDECILITGVITITSEACICTGAILQTAIRASWITISSTSHATSISSRTLIDCRLLVAQPVRRYVYLLSVLRLGAPTIDTM